MKLICYLSGGYPDFESASRLAHAYAGAGVDTIEIDVPSRAPYIDAPYIQERMKRALERCDDYDRYLDAVAALKEGLPETDILLTIYESTVREMGVDTFCAWCCRHGVLDVILTGISDDKVTKDLMAAGVRVSCYVPFDLPEDDVQRALNSDGFCYLQAVPHECQATSGHPTLASCIAYLRSRGLSTPIYCGVGVHSPSDARMVRDAGADGVFVGTAVLKLADDVPAMVEMIKEFKAAC